MTDEMQREVDRRVEEALANIKAEPKKHRKRKVQKLPNILTKPQIASFLGAFEGETRTMVRNKLFFKLLLGTGMRCNEATTMLYSDIIISDEGNPIYFLKHSKNGRQEHVPIPIPLYNDILKLSKLFKSRQQGYVFRPCSKNVPLNDRYLRKIVKVFAKKASIPFNVKIHTMRHTYASHLFNETNNIYVVSKMLRHQNLESTLIYTRLFNGEQQRASEILNLYELDKDHSIPKEDMEKTILSPIDV